MPNIKSAIKRVKQDIKRTARNRARKERMKKVLKAFDAAIVSGDAAAIAVAFKNASNIVDKAGNKGIIHKNAVSRKKSWLARKVNAASA